MDGRELKLSNLEKVLYPSTGLTKGGLIDYYSRVAPVLLAHLAGRPLTVTRWPDGVEAKSFFQKHAPAHRPEWVRTATVPARGKPIDYILAEDLADARVAGEPGGDRAARAAGAGRGSGAPDGGGVRPRPGRAGGDRGVLPRGDAATRRVRRAWASRASPRRPGSKGLQVYIPLNHDGTSYEQTKPFAKTVAELLEQAEPELVVSRMTRARRTGKVLIDWSQNDARKTTVCAYSLRASERPTASTPVEWEEVEAARDSGDPASLVFEADAGARARGRRGDLFGPVLSLVQDLPG